MQLVHDDTKKLKDIYVLADNILQADIGPSYNTMSCPTEKDEHNQQRARGGGTAQLKKCSGSAPRKVPPDFTSGYWRDHLNAARERSAKVRNIHGSQCAEAALLLREIMGSHMGRVWLVDFWQLPEAVPLREVANSIRNTRMKYRNEIPE